MEELTIPEFPFEIFWPLEKKGGTVQSLIELSAGSEVLQRVRVPIANKEKCERFNSSPEDQFDHRIQVCAGGQRG